MGDSIDTQENPEGFIQRNWSPLEQRDRLLAFLKYEKARRTLATILTGKKAEKIEWTSEKRMLAVIERMPRQEPDVEADDLGLRISFVAPPDGNTPNESVYSVILDKRDTEEYGVGDPVTTYANGINDCADPRLQMHAFSRPGMLVSEFLSGRMPTDVLEEAVSRFVNAPESELWIIPLKSPVSK